MKESVRLAHERLDIEWLEAVERDGLVEAPPGGGGGSFPAATPLGSRLDGPRVKGRRPVPAQRVDTGGEPASGGPERDRHDGRRRQRFQSAGASGLRTGSQPEMWR